MDHERNADLLDHVLLPVANEEDAHRSARALERYSPKRVTVTHVVEKGGGVPDKTAVEQSKEVAAASYDAVRETFPEAETHTTYERDVVEGIFDAASEVGATAIAYHPREGNRLVRFLSGDLSLKLVTDPRIPVLALPDPEGDD